MSNYNGFKIDGLTVRDFSKFMSPKLDQVKPGQNILGRTVTYLANFGKNLKNFTARLGCFLFKTHRWENDASLMNHIWVHLKSDEDRQDRQLIVLNYIFQQLIQRKVEKQSYLDEIESMLNLGRENVTDQTEDVYCTAVESTREESSSNQTVGTEISELSEYMAVAAEQVKMDPAGALEIDEALAAANNINCPTWQTSVLRDIVKLIAQVV